MVSLQEKIKDLSPERLKLLAQRLRGQEAQAEKLRVVPAPEERHLPFPLTEVQQAYWVGRTDLFDLGGVASHAYVEYTMGDLDVARLDRALRRLIDRHEMLRAVVLTDARQQILAQVPPYQTGVLDLRHRDAAEAAELLGALRARMSRQVRPADVWPLFEIHVTLLPQSRSLLHLSFDILIGDIWSFQTLQRDLERFYHQPDLELPPLELSFRDYVLAQAAFAATPAYRRSLDYWRERLPDLPPAPGLPLARNPSTLGAPRFRRRRASLGRRAWRSLKTRAARRGLTPSGLLLAAYAEVLAAWSKSPRFTINVTTFNRLPVHPQVNEVVGDFTSLTLVAVDGGAAPDFAGRADAVQKRLWRDLEHGQVSAVRLLREMAGAEGLRSAAPMPVVFTSLLFGQEQDGGGEEGAADSGEGAAGEEEGRADQGISQTPQVWLDHQVGEDRGVLAYNWDAVEDLFPPGVLDDMFAAYGGLIARLAEDEAAWHVETPLPLPPGQLEARRRVNETAVPFVPELLQQGFERRAARDPDRPAVFSAARVLTYGETERRANHLAWRLRRRGARPNTLVAVVMEKGWEQVVAVLAVLKAGAAYLPIDPGLPQERRAHLFEQGGVELALTQSWVDAALAWPAPLRRLRVDLESAAEDVQAPPPVQRPGDLAYVIFTSGSTGLPKGVMIDHAGALNTVADVNRRFAVGPGDRVLALSSLGFDLSVYDIFGLLAAGGAVVLPEPSAGRDPERWADLMAAHRVTVWNSVPALMEILAEHGAGQAPPAGRDRSSALARAGECLRLVLLSGDWIPVRLPDRVRELAPAAEVVSLGGATEASIWSILHPIGRVDPAWTSIPYGRPMDNQSWQVLDARLAPRPTWVAGDLYIGGSGLARGYWRDQEKTAASFFVHPRTGERLYRTGDLGRYLPDGTIEFLGRDDMQVKIQGYRVELGEIEVALERHPKVRAAAALALGERGRQRRLVACVVPRGSAAQEVAAPAPRPGEAGAPPAPPRPRRAAVAPAPAGGPLSATRLGELLACLRQVELDDFPMPKYRYPSAGNLYPVQAYVAAEPGRVAGVPEGTWYYHPREHRLVRLSAEAGLEPALAAPLAGSGDFVLFLVAQLAAVRPIYGELSEDLALLEAGYMVHLLRAEAALSGLVLRFLPELDLAGVRHRLALEDSHLPLCALLGGREGVAAAGAPAPDRPLGGGAGPIRLVAAGGRGATTFRPEIEGEVEALMFKLRQPGLRSCAAAAGRVELPGPPAGEPGLLPYRERRSWRELSREAVPAGDLAALLGAAWESFSALCGDPGPPGFEILAAVKEDRVAGLAAGVYRFAPPARQLSLVAPGHPLHEGMHIPPNRPVFAQAAFSLLLVSAPDWRPGDERQVMATLQAGALGQALMEAAPAVRLGLCPIGSLDFAPVGRFLGLPADRVLLHSLLGGRLPEPRATVARVEAGDLAAELRAHLEGRLPDYMVPASIVAVDELPLSANGKVNRKALAARLQLPVEAATAYVAPRTEMEQMVVAVWTEVLGAARIGIDDSFFDLGGHSVEVVRVHRRLRDLLGAELPISRLFSNPTPRFLAETLSRDAAGGSLREERERAQARRAARQRRRRGAGEDPSAAAAAAEGAEERDE
jgi:epothilone synthetase B